MLHNFVKLTAQINILLTSMTYRYNELTGCYNNMSNNK